MCSQQAKLTMSAMVTLTKAQVPSYLVHSEFYKNLSADDDDEFCIPQEYYKPSLSVVDANDLARLFHTIKFWGFNKLPHEVIELLIFNPQSFSADEQESIGRVLLEFDAEFGLHALYQSLSKCAGKEERLDVAGKCGLEDILEHLFLFHLDHGQFKTVLIKEVAENGHVNLLERVADTMSQLSIKNPYKSISVTIVASRGHTDCLRFLFEKGCKKQQDTCRAAAENGHLDCLKLAHQHGGKIFKPVRDAAASHGHLDCLKYTLENGCPVDADVACVAAEAGQFECFQYLIDHGAKILKRTCRAALIGGSVECVKLLRARKAPGWDLDGPRLTARHGHLAGLQYLLDNGCQADHTTTQAAAQGGHSLCLTFLLERQCEARQVCVIAAARGGHIECLRVLKKFNVSIMDSDEGYTHMWQFTGNLIDFVRSLIAVGYVVPKYTLEYAIRTGYVECVEYICANNLCALAANLTLAASSYTNRLLMLKILHRYNCPWSGADSCRQLAGYCDIESLIFAHEHGCPWDERTVFASIQRNGQECFQYALENGCPVGDDACDVAAARGWIEMLKSLHARGGALTLKTCVAAAKNKYSDCLTYAVTHGAPVDASVCEAAATFDHSRRYTNQGRTEHQTSLETLQCARRLGCPWDERTCAAAAVVQLPDEKCLQYAHENGCPWDASTVQAAAQAGQIQNLTFALQHGCPSTPEACIAAAERGHLSALKVLHEYGCPWDERVSRAARRGGSSCLRYCVDNGCPIDADTMASYNAIFTVTG